jgi:asparagine synthase (glutamine-hydrolysing)
MVQRAQYVDLVTALPDNLLVKVDRMLMGFGLEGRVPFLDHRIVELGLSLPDRLKVSRGQGKLVLKRWAERYLPPDHLYRRKRGFHVPVRELLSEGFLNGLAARLPASRGIRDWFDPGGVRDLVRQQLRGRNVSRPIMGLVQFAIWHRLFIEQPGATPAPDEEPLDWIG